MIINYFENFKHVMYVTCFVTASLTMAGQYPVDIAFKQSPITQFQPKNWKPGYNSKVIFLKDSSKKEKFVLKYHRFGASGKTDAIHDILGSIVARSVDIPINIATLLDKNSPLKEQFFSEYRHIKTTATLHSYIPGRKLPKNIDICNGLSKKINLISITESEDLCHIVAANVYLNDPDGKRSNNRFNPKTNRYYTFDKGHIFYDAHRLPNEDKQLSPYDDKGTYLDSILPKDLLATEAYDYLENMKKDELSPEHIKALKRVNQKLGQLQDTYPAAKIYDTWMNIAQEADYTYSPEKKECLKVMVEYNCHEVSRLQSLLTTLTE